MNKDISVFIEHIILSVESILQYTEGMKEKDFLSNKLVQDAVIRNLEIIGEATKHIPSDFRILHPKIEWKKMAGMRDKLIHDYMGVDIWAVWYVVEDILPDLLKELKQLLT